MKFVPLKVVRNWFEGDGDPPGRYFMGCVDSQSHGNQHGGSRYLGCLGGDHDVFVFLMLSADLVQGPLVVGARKIYATRLQLSISELIF